MKSDALKSQNQSVGRAAVVFITTILVAVFLMTRDVGNTFAFDEWVFITTRQDFSLSTLLEDHYGHFSALPVFIHVLMFKTFGLANHQVFQVLAPLWHVVTALTVGELVRRRHGFVPAYLGAVLVAMSGVGAQNFLWSFQIGFMGSLLFFVLAMVCFDNAEQDNQLKWRIATLVAICLSVASSGVGLPALGAMTLLILFTRPWRLWWWVALGPVAMFTGWFVKYGDIDTAPRPSLAQFLNFVFDGLSGTLSGTVGVASIWGNIALIVIALAVAIDIRRNGFSLRRSIWWMYLVAFWSLTAYQRGGTSVSPLSSRYLWIGTFMLLLTVSEVIPKRGLNILNANKFLASIAMAVVVAAAWGSQPLRVEWQKFQTAWSHESMVRHSIALNNKPDLQPSVPIHVLSRFLLAYDTADGFFKAVDKFGPPAQFSQNTIVETDDLHGFADQAMSDFGLLNIKTLEEPCKNSDVSTNVVTVEEGSTTTFVVNENQTVSITRFVRVGEAVASNIRQIASGTHLISLAADGYNRPLTLTFEKPIANCE